MKFADVILPLTIPGTFTYAIPDDMLDNITIGMRVEVQFGRKKNYSGIIYSIHDQKPNFKNIKSILALIDNDPIVSVTTLQLWKWVSDYYMCAIGDVMNVALPAYLKLSSETIYYLNSIETVDPQVLSDEAYMVYEALQLKDFLKRDEIEMILDGKKVFLTINELINHRLILTVESLTDKVKSKTETYIRLHPNLVNNESEMQKAFEETSKARKQQELLMYLIHEMNMTGKDSVSLSSLNKSKLFSPAQIKSLENRNIIVKEIREVDRVSYKDNEIKSYYLSTEQEEISQSIWTSTSANHLIYGITGSGKSFVYFDLIKKTIAEGKQVLFLVPEIALTTQLIQLIATYVESDFGVYHSKYNHQERVEIYNKVKNGELNLVVGVRSAIFLPFDSLGLIIVDEEHDRTYKQTSPAPRYQARDTALYLGKLFDAKVVLGSATPSLESMLNVKLKKLQYHTLQVRYGQVALPNVKIVDVSKEQKQYTQPSIFSQTLIDALEKNYKLGKQAILFQNRRGYNPFIICYQCGLVPTCSQCDVSLTYYKNIDKLKCHYCSTLYVPYNTCPQCHSTNIKAMGFGTEKIEEDIQNIFPYARIARLDQDSTRRKNAHVEIIDAFANGKIDILVGTQMLVKGLHFENVQLVGILNADSLLSFPDFRAEETAFQMFEQVAGRAGRKDEGAEVYIQAIKYNHPVLKLFEKHEYMTFVKNELNQRKEFVYPPYCKLITVWLKDKKEDVLEAAAQMFYFLCENQSDFVIKPPTTPAVSKIKNTYIREVTVKIPVNNETIIRAKHLLHKAKIRVNEDLRYRYVYIYFDVDSY